MNIDIIFKIAGIGILTAVINQILKISGNHGAYWSEDGQELFEVTCEGTIYELKGYDSSFRVALYYETPNVMKDGIVYHLYIFLQLYQKAQKQAQEPVHRLMQGNMRKEHK